MFLKKSKSFGDGSVYVLKTTFFVKLSPTSLRSLAVAEEGARAEPVNGQAPEAEPSVRVAGVVGER